MSLEKVSQGNKLSITSGEVGSLDTRATMEDLVKTAKLYYIKSSSDIKIAAWDFFKSLDNNNDEKRWRPSCGCLFVFCFSQAHLLRTIAEEPTSTTSAVLHDHERRKPQWKHLEHRGVEVSLKALDFALTAAKIYCISNLVSLPETNRGCGFFEESHRRSAGIAVELHHFANASALQQLSGEIPAGICTLFNLSSLMTSQIPSGVSSWVRLSCVHGNLQSIFRRNAGVILSYSELLNQSLLCPKVTIAFLQSLLEFLQLVNFFP
ncbi:hypothetical protein RHSIM_Rhsim02G0045300 [Rhododendron simsii]|uniref:Uncharacterized protein n=1 Tax=Rhododendron simsii TaxID=118357 RepID=A0A834H9P6_RHOSS|nr:hypothetical protein RHSIM_Rhsim02G0045300 [Rhododendron simsii]